MKDIIGSATVLAVGLYIIFLHAEIRRLEEITLFDAELIESYRRSVEEMHYAVGTGVNKIVEIANERERENAK
jgi:hypothetical protein